MELNVKERLILINILPREGYAPDLRVTRKLREDLSFSEEEHKKYKFVLDGNQVNWDDSVEQVSEIETGEKATDIITQTISDLEQRGKLPDDLLDLHDKLVKTG